MYSLLGMCTNGLAVAIKVRLMHLEVTATTALETRRHNKAKHAVSVH